jgi:hypothetical protein
VARMGVIDFALTQRGWVVQQLISLLCFPESM